MDEEHAGVPAEARSADGTAIAYRALGSGPAVVIVGGALSTAEAAVPLATALAESGFRGVVLDRRGRAGAATPRRTPLCGRSRTWRR